MRIHLMRGMTARHVPREVCGPAQRHPSVHRRRRADAAAGRRAPDGLGRRPGTSPARPSPTPITPCCPRRWRSGPCRCLPALLPRHLEIIYEINRRFLDEVRRQVSRRRRPRCAHVAHRRARRRSTCAWPIWPPSAAMRSTASPSCTPNCSRKTMLHDFYELWPEKFLNVTNGVTPRRLMALSNPRAGRRSSTGKIGDGWLTDLKTSCASWSRLPTMRRSASSGARSSRRAKRELAALIEQRTGVVVDPATLFDIQVKRIHEYKRQHLNILHVITLYNRLKKNPQARHHAAHRSSSAARPRPATSWPSCIIKLINSVAEVVNSDPAVRDRAEGRLLPRLQREERPAHLSRRRPVGADLDRGQGGLGHRQHEVLHERRAHHRHPGRRQRRNSRGSRRGKLLPLRPHHSRGRRPSRRAATIRASITSTIPTCGKSSTRFPPGRSPPATPRSSSRSSIPCSMATNTWSWPTTRPTSNARTR